MIRPGGYIRIRRANVCIYCHARVGRPWLHRFAHRRVCGADGGAMHRSATELRHDLYRLDGRRFDLAADEYASRRASLLRQIARAEARQTSPQHVQERRRTRAERIVAGALLLLVAAALCAQPVPAGPMSAMDATGPEEPKKPRPWPFPWPFPSPNPTPQPGVR